MPRGAHITLPTTPARDIPYCKNPKNSDTRRNCCHHPKIWFCLCWSLTSQSTIFQSCRDGATASWVINQYFRGVKCLAQGHNTAAVGFQPPTSRSGVRHSTTLQPRNCRKSGNFLKFIGIFMYFHLYLNLEKKWNFPSNAGDAKVKGRYSWQPGKMFSVKWSPCTTFIHQIVKIFGKITQPWNTGHTDLHLKMQKPIAYQWLISEISLEGLAWKQSNV